MKPDIYHILPDEDAKYEQYGGVFLSIIHIIRVLVAEGVYSEHIKEQDLPCTFKSTRKMLLDAVTLICYGKDEVTVSLIMDMAYNRQLLKQGVTEQEVNELLIARVLISLFMKREYDTIYDIINFFGDEPVRRTLLADYPVTELNRRRGE